MEFVQEGSSKDNNYSDEDKEGEGGRETSNLFPNSWSSDYSHHPWLHEDSSRSIMDLSLGGGNNNNNNSTNSSREEQQQEHDDVVVEREHMFDKVVTPSDVGKLNRLVIPKQHAEKYFPLESGGDSNSKGLLLNFEDRNGKPWRFRYSYWNSSQSYVMTKGWSRFVKEKKLDAGDIVSFHRGRPDHAKDRLFIDWRRRPAPALRWANATLYSGPINNYPLPQYPYPNPNHYHHPYHRHLYPPEPLYYLRPTQYHHGSSHVPMVIDSVPLLHGIRSTSTSTSTSTTTTPPGKNKLRLFGVNMECQMSDDIEDHRLVLPSTALLPLPPPPPNQFSDKGSSPIYSLTGLPEQIKAALPLL